MNLKKKMLYIFSVLFFSALASALGQSAFDLNFQGILTDIQGNPIGNEQFDLSVQLRPESGQEVLFEIINSKNEKVYEKKAILSEFGTVSGEFKTQSFFSLGTYTITMIFAQGEKDKVSSNFEVQEFRPPRHFVKIHFSRSTWLNNVKDCNRSWNSVYNL